MPENQSQRVVYTLITIVITVSAFVYYSLYVVNGSALMECAGTDRVMAAIRELGGVYMFGRYLPIWAVIVIECCLAFCLDIFIAGPCSFKMACRKFDPAATHPVIFELAIISSTVLLMCPSMSFLAAWSFYPYHMGFHIWTLIGNYLRLVCFNFPFALLAQVFFIQPFVRMVFRHLYRKDIARRQANDA